MLMVDFENAFISTFKEEFPTAVIRDRFFSFYSVCLEENTK